jgi:hypothetical protein
MKSTRYDVQTNMETVLINHQNDYIAYDGKIKTGSQWLEWLRKNDEETLTCEVTLNAQDADYYDFEMLIAIRWFGKDKR